MSNVQRVNGKQIKFEGFFNVDFDQQGLMWHIFRVKLT